MEEETEQVPADSFKPAFSFLRSMVLALIIVGALVSAYLFYRYNMLVTGGIAAQPDVCSAVFGKGCDNALKSSVSSVLGLPLSAWGILYYLTLGVLLVVQAFTGSLFKKEALFTIFVLTLVACLGSIVLLTTMLIKPALFCPGCAAIHLINFSLFFLSDKITGHSVSQIIRFNPGNAALLVKNYVKNLTGFKIAGLVIVLLTVGVFYFDLRIITASPQTLNGPANPRTLLAGFRSAHPETIPIDKDDPVLGAAGANVQLVVFSDLTCPACRLFSHELTKLNHQYGDKLAIVFKHFPLGMACNPSMTRDVHPRACEAALAAEAAKQQGKFWPYQDAVFAADLNNIHKTVCSIASVVGLNGQRFDTDRIADAAIAKVKKDVDLGIRLGVKATPTVFLDGRQVNDTRYESLVILVNDELGRGVGVKAQ